MRYAIFVHDPDGDMGDGRIAGPFNTLEKAEARADVIRRRSYDRDADRDTVEAIVLDLVSAKTSAREIVRAVRAEEDA